MPPYGVAYRDSFESCPRCGNALEDARDVRACNACRGQWVLETVIAEMVMEMVPAGVYGRLRFAPSTSGTGVTACPSCGVTMDAVSMFGVGVERCPKQHGVWFDSTELEIALRRAADPAMHAGPAPADSNARLELVFGIQQPGDVYREIRVRENVIKIGRLDVCHVHVSDERVAPIHAVIELTDGGPEIFDLGSSEGTLIGGTRVNKHLLASGNRILIGATTITVTFESS